MRTARLTPGSIGMIIAPQLTSAGDNASLPHASNLRGACSDACPVSDA